MFKYLLGILTIALALIDSAQAVPVKEHSIGVGFSSVSIRGYRHNGAIVDAKLYTAEPIDPTLYFSVTSTLATWWANNSSKHKHAETLAFSGIFHAYFNPPESNQKPSPYLEVGIGPGFITHKNFGGQLFGSNLILQTNLGGGVNLSNQFGISLRALHYCNAGLFKPNKGTTMPMLSIHYNFD